jgi:hypothetical protein
VRSGLVWSGQAFQIEEEEDDDDDDDDDHGLSGF